MLDSTVYWYDESAYIRFLKRVYEIIIDFCISSLRLYVGFLLTNNFINCNSLLTWCLEISFVDYLCERAVNKFIKAYYPELIQNSALVQIFPKMLSFGVVSILYQQSLLVLLFSESLYWLFTYYSKIFSRLFVETLSIFYYYQNPWFIFPLFINVILSLLYFLDSIYETELLASFSQFSFFKFFLTEWGLAITPFHQPRKTLLQKNNTHSYATYNGLTEEDNYHFSILKQRYLPYVTELTLHENLHEILEFLADSYYKHQIYFTDKKYNVHVLPLEWIDFQRMTCRVSGYERLKMLQAYYQHPYHTAWRLLKNQNEWCSKDENTNYFRTELMSPTNLEFIATIWEALRQEHGISKDPNVFKIKSEIFIRVLAKINRFRNGHLYHGRREHDLDDLMGDKIATMEILYNLLFPLVAERHSEERLSPEVLNKLLHSFTKSIWIENFSKLDHLQRQELAQIWQTILTDEQRFHDQIKYFDAFKLDSTHKDDFYLKMNALFGKQWLEDIRYAQMIEIHFDSVQPHILKHHHIFSEAMSEFESIDEYQSRSLFSI
jgi:hypothetical protein